MPKRVHTINQFHGGLNSFSDPRDAVENQLTEANDLMVDELGKVRTIGSSSAASNGIVSKGTSEIEAGHGLMHFQHDYAGLGSTYASGVGLGSPTAMPTSYTILASPATDQRVYIYGHPQDDKIGVEIPVEVGRTFPSGETTFWTNAGSCYQYDDEGDLSLIANAAGQYASLPVAKCSTNIGTAYRISFEVSGSAGSWFLKSENGAQTISTITGDGTITLDFIATTTGGFRLEAGAINGYQIGGSGVWYNKITIDNISMVEGGWSQLFDLGSEDNFKLQGFVTDGQLRIHDSNFNNAYTPKWFGFLKRDYFSVSELFEGWYSENSIYTSPSVTGSTDASPTQVAGKFNHTTTSIGAPLGSISIGFTEGSGGYSTGTWDFANDNYLFYVSYIHDGGYDSPLVYLVDSDKLTTVTGDNKQLVIRVSCKTIGLDTWFNEHSPRIIGFRLYFKQDVSYWTQPSAAWCIQETYFSSEKGSRTPLSGTWREWIFSTGGNENTYVTFADPPEIISFEDINGYKEDEETFASFKTIAIVNRKAYIGNIKQGGVVYGDMMLKSPVNGFDLFPQNRGIEVSVRDGDDIVKIEEYADRLLQFKKTKMHLINISQEIEFLEDTYMHKGIDYPTASCKTDFGIAWVNKHGCYLYNGKNVDNLLEKQGRKMISDFDWETHTSNHVSVSYLPKSRQLIVCNDLGETGNKNIYLYDMVTASWVTGTQAMNPLSADKLTNIITDKNGDLMWGKFNSGTVEFRKWDNSSAWQSSFNLKSKSMSFGSPTQRKNIYNVQISYQGDGSLIVPTYGLNGDTTPADTFTSGTLSNVGVDKWTHTKLIPSSTVNNAQSFRFQLSGTAGANFAINDITVVYRLKSVK